MNITFYNYDGENNVVNKILTGGVLKTGTTRGEFNVISPTILVNGNPAEYNYCYIAEFNRYYYIAECRSVRSGVFEMSCRVDVLKTYATDILKCPAIAARSAKPETQNAYLIDDERKPYAPKTVVTKLLLPSAFSYGSSYILQTAG